MFDILRKSLATGIATTEYPACAPTLSSAARGKPEIDYPAWQDARPCAAACATGAISFQDAGDVRTVIFDLGKCSFCGLCAEIDPGIRNTNQCELAATSRRALLTVAMYKLGPDGRQESLLELQAGTVHPRVTAPPAPGASINPLVHPSTTNGGTHSVPSQVADLGERLKHSIHQVLGRSLHIREVDAGSCNGCEMEIVGLNSPIYDLERFGIHFVASPRHADMLLVTGPVTRNMELALRKTYEATPEPRLVVAVGACGCSGGIFGVNYATRGAVDNVIPVDVFIPGCPPNPFALLHGILLAMGRLAGRRC